MNDNDVKRILISEATTQLQQAELLPQGSVEQQTVVENACKLIKEANEMDFKSCEKEEKKKDRLIKLGLGIATVGISLLQLIVFFAGFNRTLNIEDGGALTSQTARQSFSNSFKFLK